MTSEMEYVRVADALRRDLGSQAQAHALQELVQATQEENAERVEFWRYVSLLLALGTPFDIAAERAKSRTAIAA
jgi:uncharacterized protein YegL